MKKLFFIAMVLMAAMMSANVESFAQTQYAKFKGISMDEPLSSFVNKLTKDGFELYEIKDGTAYLTGKFAGDPDCMIAVHSEKGVVDQVTVMFSFFSSWELAKYKYDSLKENFKLKYNYSPIEHEHFEDSCTSDLLKYYALKEIKAEWYCGFKIPGGGALISIDAALETGLFALKIVYYDNINREIVKASEMEDI
jgi:hypothetical protein